MTLLTPLEMFFRWEEQMPEEPFLFQPVNDEPYAYTWQEVGDQARRVAAYIHQLHLPPFTKIGILSENCAHWVITDLAIMMAKHISVPLFPNMGPGALGKVIRHSDIDLLFVGKLDHFEDLRPEIEGLRSVAFPFYGPRGLNEEWDHIIQQFDPVSGSITVDAGTPATIVYTSGTSDRPKGAMHDYYNLTFVSDHYKNLLGIQPGDRLISHLPLAQMAERVMIELQAIYCGASITFLEYSENFFSSLRDTKPTLFGTLPHYWGKIREQITSASKSWPLQLSLNLPIIGAITRSYWKRRLGLNKTRLFLTGGAPMPPDLKQWFAKLGIKLDEIYARTEDTCYSHSTLLSPSPIGTVGQALTEVDVRLSDQCEVLVKHEGMMRGYYKETELTIDAFTNDGYLKTGDLGQLDEAGHLTLLGRMDDEKKFKDGSVQATELEQRVSRHRLIDRVCIIGDDEEERIALTVLMEPISSHSEHLVSKELEKVFEKVNRKLPSYQRMTKMVVMRDPMTVENGLLTPTMKIKRSAIERTFAAQRQQWRGAQGNVLWVDTDIERH